MSPSSNILIGVEVGLLKGLENLRWASDSIQNFGELIAVSTVVQTQGPDESPRLRVVFKISTGRSPEQVVEELEVIEKTYQETLQMLEPLCCFLLVFEQEVSLSPLLTLPHPALAAHPSWLYCAWEVWRSYEHPVLNQSLERIVASSNLTNVQFYSQGKSIVAKSYL